MQLILHPSLAAAVESVLHHPATGSIHKAADGCLLPPALEAKVIVVHESAAAAYDAMPRLSRRKNTSCSDNCPHRPPPCCLHLHEI